LTSLACALASAAANQNSWLASNSSTRTAAAPDYASANASGRSPPSDRSRARAISWCQRVFALFHHISTEHLEAAFFEL
jgi:hypothetical protein